MNAGLDLTVTMEAVETSGKEIYGDYLRVRLPVDENQMLSQDQLDYLIDGIKNNFMEVFSKELIDRVRLAFSIVLNDFFKEPNEIAVQNGSAYNGKKVDTFFKTFELYVNNKHEVFVDMDMYNDAKTEVIDCESFCLLILSTLCRIFGSEIYLNVHENPSALFHSILNILYLYRAPFFLHCITELTEYLGILMHHLLMQEEKSVVFPAFHFQTTEQSPFVVYQIRYEPIGVETLAGARILSCILLKTLEKSVMCVRGVGNLNFRKLLVMYLSFFIASERYTDIANLAASVLTKYFTLHVFECVATDSQFQSALAMCIIKKLKVLFVDDSSLLSYEMSNLLSTICEKKEECIGLLFVNTVLKFCLNAVYSDTFLSSLKLNNSAASIFLNFFARLLVIPANWKQEVILPSTYPVLADCIHRLVNSICNKETKLIEENMMEAFTFLLDTFKPVCIINQVMNGITEHLCDEKLREKLQEYRIPQKVFCTMVDSVKHHFVSEISTVGPIVTALHKMAEHCVFPESRTEEVMNYMEFLYNQKTSFSNDIVAKIIDIICLLPSAYKCLEKKSIVMNFIEFGCFMAESINCILALIISMKSNDPLMYRDVIEKLWILCANSGLSEYYKDAIGFLPCVLSGYCRITNVSPLCTTSQLMISLNLLLCNVSFQCELCQKYSKRNSSKETLSNENYLNCFDWLIQIFYHLDTKSAITYACRLLRHCKLYNEEQLRQFVELFKFITNLCLKPLPTNCRFADLTDCLCANLNADQARYVYERVEFPVDYVMQKQECKTLEDQQVNLIECFISLSLAMDIHSIFPTIHLLLTAHFLGSVSSHMVARALFFNLISEFGSDPVNIYQTNKIEVCSLLVQCSFSLLGADRSGKVITQIENDSNKYMKPFKEAVSVFNFSDDYTDFLCENIRIIIPFVLSARSEASNRILRALVEETGIPRKTIIVENLQHVFVHLVRRVPVSEWEPVLQFCAEQTNCSLPKLLLISRQPVSNEISSVLSTDERRVFMAFDVIVKMLNTTFSHRMSSYEFILDKFPGMLLHFDKQLSSSFIPLNVKEEILYSLVVLINYFEQHVIIQFCSRIVGTIRTGMCHLPVLKHASSRVWKAFFEKVEISRIGPSIFLSAVISIGNLGEDASEIFSFLVKHRKKAICSIIHPFLLPSPFNSFLENDSNKKQPFVSRLSLLLDVMVNESAEILIYILKKLLDLLESDDGVSWIRLHSQEVVDDPVMTRLIIQLLQNSRDVSTDVRLLTGRCLGAIGALDCGRVDLHLKVQVRHCFSVKQTSWAKTFCTELVRSYLSQTEVDRRDCAAFALQEAVKFYQTELSETSSLWRELSEQTKEILLQFKNSKYSVKLTNDNPLTQQLQSINSESDCEKWLTLRTYQLINSLPSNEHDYDILRAAQFIVGHDVDIARFLFPLVLLSTILHSDKKIVNSMSNELISVLSQTDRHNPSNTMVHHKIGIVCSLIDYLQEYGVSSDCDANTSGSEKVEQFLNTIPVVNLIESLLYLRSYAQALHYLEDAVRRKQIDFYDHLSLLQEIYWLLGDKDNVVGVMKIHSHPSLTLSALACDAKGLTSEAAACYEIIIGTNETTAFEYYERYLNTLILLGQLANAYSLATTVANEHPEWSKRLMEFRMEAAWRLGEWNLLNKLCSYDFSTENERFESRIGRAFNAYIQKDHSKAQEFLDKAVFMEVGLLASSCIKAGIYHRAYDSLLKLQLIYELQNDIKRCSLNGSQQIDKSSLIQQSMRPMDLFLNVKRATLQVIHEMYKSDSIVNIEEDLLFQHQKSLYIRNARVCRKEGHMQAAYHCIMRAENMKMTQQLDVVIEKAFWQHDKGDTSGAILVLENALKDKNNKSETLYGEILLLLARWNVEACTQDSDSLLKQFKVASECCKNSEEAHFRFANFMDRLGENQNPLAFVENLPAIIESYCTSLLYGSTFIYQSLPRLFTLWFDFGKHINDSKSQSGPFRSVPHNILKQALLTVTQHIEKWSASVCTYFLLAVISQLVSRICHSNNVVSEALMNILANIIIQYPQQAIWMLVSVSQSTNQIRSDRCKRLFALAKRKKQSIESVVCDCLDLCSLLVELCERRVSNNVSRLLFSENFQKLKGRIERCKQLMLPLQRQLTVTLPILSGFSSAHEPFPIEPIYFVDFEDEIEVMRSLQKPKKIVVRGSDGKQYAFLCKSRDDLRIDHRLMEFNCIVNKCFQRDPQSRRRSLYIRTYSVTPINDQCGIIEMIPDVITFRSSLVSLYKEKNVDTSMGKIKKLMGPQDVNADIKYQIFKERLLPYYQPPVFHKWFLRTFLDPVYWYTSRLTFTRTAAVMSMVGWVVGLGDRHGENILLDAKTGDCVHVDFNCLFNKAEQFQVPEVVPFRLTHNMIDGMGPLRLEGTFRHCCENALKVMHDEQDALLSVLQTFVYDPLVEWKRHSSANQQAGTSEVTNSMAQTQIENIRKRLRGHVVKTSQHSTPLSIEGQVDYLLKTKKTETDDFISAVHH